MHVAHFGAYDYTSALGISELTSISDILRAILRDR
jgi:hypothetical protein